MGEKTQEHKPFIRMKSRSSLEHVHYSVLYEGFPEEFQEVAIKELKETPEDRKRGIQRLREYMESKNMPALNDDTMLLTALRNCKYNVKNAEMKLKKMISVRKDIVVRLRNIGMEAIEQILDDMPFGMLPYRDKFGRVIVYTRPTALRLDLYSLSDVAAVGYAIFFFLLYFPITSVSGYAYFGDCTCPSLHLFYSILKEFRTNLVNIFSLPIKIARVEILNVNSMCRCFMNVIKPFMSKKLVSRIALHGNSFEKIHEMYDPSILAEQFGGTAGPLSSKAYKEKFLDYVRDLLDEEC